MTVKELIAELQEIHGDMEVHFDSVDGLREVNAVNVETIGQGQGNRNLIVILTDEE